MCVCVGVLVSVCGFFCGGVRSVYCSLYYLFWPLHAYFSSRRSGEQIFRCILSGGRNKFVCTSERVCSHTHTLLGKQINRRALRALWLGLVGVTGAGAAHKVTPHLTENHIKTR